MPQHAVPCRASCSARAGPGARRSLPLPRTSPCVALTHRQLGSPLPKRSPRGAGSVQARFPRAVGGCWHSPLGSQPLADRQTDRQTDLPGAGAEPCAAQSQRMELGNAHGARHRAACAHQDVQGWGCRGLWCLVVSSSPRFFCPRACRAQLCGARLWRTALVQMPCARSSCPAPVQAAGGCSPVPRGGSTHRAMPAPGPHGPPKPTPGCRAPAPAQVSEVRGWGAGGAGPRLPKKRSLEGSEAPLGAAQAAGGGGRRWEVGCRTQDPSYLVQNQLAN